MDLAESLRSLTVQHADKVGVLQWAFESDRWAELVFCVISSQPSGDPSRARGLTEALSVAGVIRPAELAQAGTADSTGGIVVRHLFAQYGFPPEHSESAIDRLATFASAVASDQRSGMQSWLREKARELRHELSAMFGDPGDADSALQAGLTLWLQNALNLPLPLEDRYALEFCEAQGCTIDDLVAAADEVDLNVAVVDDLIRAAAEAAEAPAGTPLWAIPGDHGDALP